MSPAPVRTKLELPEAALRGMMLALVARSAPDRMAIVSPYGDRTFDALNAQANQLVRALRARGLGAGDAVALVCSNRPEFAAVTAAVARSGLRVTPINWHLTAPEIAYIVDNCEARALVADARFAEAASGAAEQVGRELVKLAVGGEISGFDAFDDALADQSPDDIEDPQLGGQMLYTSGTTGRPKGVHRRPAAPAAAASGGGARRGAAIVATTLRYKPGEDVHLCTGPVYHAAPLAFSLSQPLAAGCTVVMMDGWNPARSLALIEEHQVTHTHMVPTMFHRLLALPEEVRTHHDLSSLRVVLHGAAPCPVPVKRALIEWLGPVVYEYYAATEGWGSFVTSEQWLERPGTVGKPDEGQVAIRDEEGKPQPPGTPGTIYLRAPEAGRFEYYKDPDKTSKSYDGEGHYFTLGDVGYLDEDGHLFLCDRSADVIISGGVNIYPAEIDAVLLTHPAVGDAASVGVPNEEWGEEVLGVVELAEGFEPCPALAEELVAHCRSELAHFKCPRRVEFTDALPRYETGKIYRRILRDRYWEDRSKRV